VSDKHQSLSRSKDKPKLVEYQITHFAVAAGLAAGDAAGAVVATGLAAGVAAGVGVANGVASGMPDCKTEFVPLIAGNESDKAISMKAAAAPIVIFARSVCVPRGPNAVLDTELENSAPASALPGCSRMHRTRITQERINSPYKM
jgi:hypothetical protein